MWVSIAEDTAQAAGFNVWYFLGALVAALVAIAGLIVNTRSNRTTKSVKRREVKQAAQEGASAYKEMADEIFTRLLSENRRLVNRAEAAEAESDGWRRRWEECVQARFGGGDSNDNSSPSRAAYDAAQGEDRRDRGQTREGRHKMD